MSIAAIVSNGGDWPNAEGKAAQGAVIIMSSEDTADDTIVPRLKAAGADLSQILIVEPMVTEKLNGKTRERVFNLGDDLRKLQDVIAKERANGRDVKLIILDPVNAYFGGPNKADSHKSADMRALLTPLSRWADENSVTVIGITHFNKGSNAHTLYRITDSGAITAVARAVWFAVRDETSRRMMLLSGKNNLGRDANGLAYEIEEADAGNGIRAPRIVWDGPVSITAEDALGQRKDRNPDALEEAKGFIADMLNAGPVSAKHALKEARAHGISNASLKRAKDALGIEATKDGYQGAWQWALPADDDFEEED